MSSIFDTYTAEQLREIYTTTAQENWPEDFLHFIHDEIAGELLDEWLEQSDMDEYMEKAREIVEDLTYGLEDDNGNELLDFLP
jgi:hypothetical protein